MILDARTLSDGQRLEADVCIVGAGAAGITLALELEGSGLDVLLLEAGGTGFSDEAQDLYAGEIVAEPFETWPLDEARLRMLGGSTNHWAGYAAALRPIDFAPRPDIGRIGWPIGAADLAPYYERAARWIELHDGPREDVDAFVAAGAAPPVDFGPGLTSIVQDRSPPTSFGFVYEDRLRRAANIRCALHANLLHIGLDEAGEAVETLSLAAAPGGPRFTATAKHVVLAMGGIETARILLLSDDRRDGGIGNENGHLGRYFMDHAGIRPSVRVLAGPAMPDMTGYTSDIPYGTGGGGAIYTVVPTEELLLAEGLGDFTVNVYESRDQASPGLASAQAMAADLRRGRVPERLGHHVATVATDLDAITGRVWEKAVGARADGGDPFGRRWYDAWVNVEQLPNPDSRVTLTDATDAFGQRRVALAWRLQEADTRTAQRASELFAAAVGRQGLGRGWIDADILDGVWPQDRGNAGGVGHGKHHSGTTRMSDDPKDGVVDADCRLHSVRNLHVASSAVFPAVGALQPTYTIVALSVRLADRLKTLLAA